LISVGSNDRFFITHIIHADPVGVILGGNPPIELVDQMMHQLGLDKPVLLQFIDYLKGIFMQILEYLSNQIDLS